MAHIAVPQAGARQWAWLLASFTRREILNRYAGSVSGLAWSLLHPLAQLAVFAFVFSQIFRVGVPPAFTGVSYAAYVAIAMWPWIMFSEGLTRGMGSVHANAGLIKKVLDADGPKAIAFSAFDLSKVLTTSQKTSRERCIRY